MYSLDCTVGGGWFVGVGVLVALSVTVLLGLWLCGLFFCVCSVVGRFGLCGLAGQVG